MLKNLIKYEFKATAPIFLMAYVVVVLLAGIYAASRLLGPHGFSGLAGVMTTLSGLLFGIAVAAAFLLTFVIIIVRFYRMLGDEGYLWFTLPVTPTQQILGKFIPAMVWIVVTFVVTLGSVAITTRRLNWPSQLGTMWHSLEAQGFHPGVWLTCGVVFILVSLGMEVLTFYASMAWGPNLIKSTRLGGSVVAYIIFYCALELLNLVGLVTMVALFSKTFKATQNLPPVMTSADVATLNQAGLIFGSYFAVEYLVLAVVCFLLTRYFISRKLNLA